MNGRTVRKLLMRGRVGTFYGARALFVVRIPLGAIPEPVPKFKAPPGEPSFEGQWFHKNADGTRTLYSITELHSGFKPTPEKLTKRGFTPDIHHAELVSSDTDEDGEVCERWTWYEGVEWVLGPQEDSSKLAPLILQRNLPKELVDAYVARRRWVKKYATGTTPEWTGIAWLDELHRASGCAKRFQPVLRDEVVDLAYFVRWYNPETKLWFCAQMSRALKEARRAKVDVRVLRPPRRK